MKIGYRVFISVLIFGLTGCDAVKSACEKVADRIDEYADVTCNKPADQCSFCELATQSAKTAAEGFRQSECDDEDQREAEQLLAADGVIESTFQKPVINYCGVDEEAGSDSATSSSRSGDGTSAAAGGPFGRGKRLVVLVMDHSATLVGLDDRTGSLDPGIRTDQSDDRITFFTQIINNLPIGYQVSVVRMNDRDTRLEDCERPDSMINPCTEPKNLCSQAYGLKEPAICALQSLEDGEKGGTPLNDTLKEVFDILLRRTYPDFDPVVVVFTDGLEELNEGGGGDSSIGYEIGTGIRSEGNDSNDILGPGQARDVYVNGVNFMGIPVPVVVVHLQPPPTSIYKRGRDEKLETLACETGGEYILLDDAEQFRESQLLDIVGDRIRGTRMADCKATQ